MSRLGDAVLGTGALVGADYLTGHVASNTIMNGVSTLTGNIAGQTGSILSGTAANINAPVIGAAAPLATLGALGYGVYRGFKKTGEHGVIRGVQEGTLSSGLILGVGGLTGVLSTAALATATPLVATGLGIYGARKAYELSSVFLTAPATHTSNAIKAPFRWAGNAAKWVRGGKKNTA